MTRYTGLRQLAQDTHDPFAGHWSAIMWQPELTGVQAFAIGVLVRSHDEIAFKLMDEPERLACFYSTSTLAKDFAWLTSLVRQYLAGLNAAEEIRLPTFNVSTTPPRYVSGESAQGVAEALFSKLVAAAAPGMRERKVRDSLDTASLRTLVHRELKRIAGLSYEQIVREKHQVIHDRGDHLFDVDIVTTAGVGSVISADYEAHASIERNLLRAAQDVGTYSNCRDKKGRGIFIYAPDRPDLSKAHRQDLEGYLREECWKLEFNGFQVATNFSPGGLAQDVLAWAEPLIS